MSSKIGEIRALTGIRGVAALAVMLSHFSIGHYLPDVQFFVGAIYWADPAVDLFFMLSAFVLCHIYVQVKPTPQAVRHYFSARFARIYPLYLATLLFILLLSSLAAVRRGHFADDLSVGDAIRQALVVNSWPYIGSNIHWNLPAWSISAEAFCYVFCFPLFWIFWPQWGSLKKIPLIILIMALLSAAFFYTPRSSDMGNCACARAVFGFAIGALVFGVSHQWKTFSKYAAAISSASGACFIALLIVCGLFGVSNQYLFWIFPTLIMGIAAESNSVVSKVLSSGPVHYLGMISYSMYLWHWPLVKMLIAVIPSIAQTSAAYRSWLFIPFTLGVIIVSSGSYEYLEKPARRILRGKLAHANVSR